ncbi:glycoside hydrolase family 79 protein [Favolaschia claudopus]|uniref:Glycoside hydrolase family 79 protein n=1 Tax=Favolaschia claudopus TaxID=2862362 RepID=A0AAW0CMN1_9AGAR
MVQLTPDAAARREEAERQPLSAQEAKAWMTDKEREDGETLAAVTGADFEQAICALRKHNGDMDKAANSLLTGTAEDQRREENLAEIRQNFAHLFPEEGTKGQGTPPPATRRSANDGDVVIDLTGDEDDELPMETTRFRATTRSPDPAWQMVPVGNNPAVKSEDDQLREVMQASLNDFQAETEDDVMPPEEIVLREDGRPIALRADVASKAYAALVVIALFAVPQVRQRCSKLKPRAINDAQPDSNAEYAMWAFIEMLTALDLGKPSVYIDEDLLNAWEAPPMKPGDSVGHMSKIFLDQVVRIIQSDIDAQQVDINAPNKLFHFTHCRAAIAPPPSNRIRRSPEPDLGHIVQIEVDPYPGSTNQNYPQNPTPHSQNDLITRLSQMLNTYNAADGSSEHQLIQNASELVTFEVVSGAYRNDYRNNNKDKDGGSGSAANKNIQDPQPFVFPRTLYMDRFLDGSLEKAEGARRAERRVGGEVVRLRARRGYSSFLSQDQDAFEMLRGAIEYYEHVAACADVEENGREERKGMLEGMAGKLRRTLGRLEGEVADIDKELTKLYAERDAIWEDPGLRCHPYDLRAVLMHTGLPGRKHIYAYVRDQEDEGKWWKVVDYKVTEVSEQTILTDSTGLHLGAGPYMLVYSRRQTEEERKREGRVRWPEGFVVSSVLFFVFLYFIRSPSSLIASLLCRSRPRFVVLTSVPLILTSSYPSSTSVFPLSFFSVPTRRVVTNVGGWA